MKCNKLAAFVLLSYCYTFFVFNWVQLFLQENENKNYLSSKLQSLICHSRNDKFVYIKYSEANWQLSLVIGRLYRDEKNVYKKIMLIRWKLMKEVHEKKKTICEWAPTRILLTVISNDFLKNKWITFIRKKKVYENIYLSMSSVKIENSTLSLYIDDIEIDDKKKDETEQRW